MFLVIFSGQSEIASVFLGQSHGLRFFEYVFSYFAMNSEEDDFNLLKQKHCIFKHVAKFFGI